jgi:hypothetical protein
LTTTNVDEDAEKQEPLYTCWWECKLAQPSRKAIWRSLKKLKIELPYDPVMPVLGIYLKEHKSGYNIHLYTDVHPSTIHNSQTTETTQCPTTDESIKKM